MLMYMLSAACTFRKKHGKHKLFPLEDIVKGAKGKTNVQGRDKRYIGPDAQVINFFVEQCADTVYNNASDENYFFQGNIGGKVLTKLGAKMIKDFNFSPGAKVKTFGLFNYTDKCGKLKLENACCQFHVYCQFHVWGYGDGI
eukprot:Stramenopile-MAST_4_protein_4641